MLGYAPSVVNDSLFMFRMNRMKFCRVVLWIGLFSTYKMCHLTGPSGVHGRIAKVLCCSLKFVHKLG